MVKVGLISDTHDDLDSISKAIKEFGRKVSLVLHAGDWNAPFSLAKFAGLEAKVMGVYGNVDGEREGLRERGRQLGIEILGDFGEIEIGGLKFAILHGTIDSIVVALAKCGEYDVVVRGHEHRSYAIKVGSSMIINPGECCGYLHGRKTIAILDTETLGIEFIEL